MPCELKAPRYVFPGNNGINNTVSWFRNVFHSLSAREIAFGTLRRETRKPRGRVSCFVILSTPTPANRCCRHSDSPLKMAWYYLNGYLAGFPDSYYNTRGTLRSFPFPDRWRLKISRTELILDNKLRRENRCGKFILSRDLDNASVLWLLSPIVTGWRTTQILNTCLARAHTILLTLPIFHPFLCSQNFRYQPRWYDFDI